MLFSANFVSSAESRFKAPSFKKKSEKAVKTNFKDVPISYWGYNAIEKVTKDKIMFGTGRNYFNPEDYVTNAELISIITRIYFPKDIKVKENDKNFSSKNWYDVNYAVAKKRDLLKNLYAFEPLEPANRYQAATIIYNTYKTMKSNISYYGDIEDLIPGYYDMPDIYQLPVKTVYGLQIMQGVDDNNNFAGRKMLTRAEMAIIYGKLLNVKKKNYPVLSKPSNYVVINYI